MKLIKPQLGFAALFVVLGGLGLYFAFGFKVEAGYAGVSSRFFPFLISSALLACGTALAWHAVSGGFRALDVEPAAPAIKEGAIALGALAAYTLVIAKLGFVLASAVLFAGVAFAFGSKRWALNLGVGVALALPVYQLFSRGLNVNLPALLKGFL